MTTQLVTVTRTTVLPLLNISTKFDTLNNLNGWHSNFEKNKWLQTDGSLNLVLGHPGPSSDWSSITTGLKNITSTRPITVPCSIPYVVSVYPDKTEYYCRKISIISKTNFVCGLMEYPQISNNRQVGVCTLGYYMLITSDKFDNEIGSYRSRLYSPVFKLAAGIDKFCLSFKYNIFTSSDDGFRVYVENYLYQDEFKIVYTKRGPLREDKWYSIEIPVYNVTYDQIIVIN